MLKLTSSKKEARRLIQGGGAKVNGEKVEDEMYEISTERCDNDEIVVGAGKKRAGVLKIVK